MWSLGRSPLLSLARVGHIQPPSGFQAGPDCSSTYFPILFVFLSLLPSMLRLWLDRIKGEITCISA